MTRPVVRARRILISTYAGGALLLGALGAASWAGIRFNTSASMPHGLWRVRPAVAPLRRGDVVAVCLPDNAMTREAAHRAYVGVGRCPGAYEPLIKPVAALPGDLVTVSTDGLSVNGQAVNGTAQLVEDSAGRPLQPMPTGVYRVAPGQVWLLSGHDPRSFDSRYFGPLPIGAVSGIARPLWVMP